MKRFISNQILYKRISVIFKINVSVNDLRLIKKKEKKSGKLIWTLDEYTWTEKERMVHKNEITRLDQSWLKVT